MHVRKIYVEGEAGGAATSYWEQIWRRTDELDARGVSTIMERLLTRHLPAGGTVLESGCGTADVVEWLDGRGFTGLGVDLADEALGRARHRRAATRLAVADITALPFPDESFDGLVSLGVVEHFEGGPEVVLREQRRVLRPGGILFLTVPRLSWYRRFTDFRELTLGRRPWYQQRGRIVTAAREIAVDEVGPGAFHQYEFPDSWIRDLVAGAGFDIVDTQPTGVAEATAEGPVLRRLGRLAGRVGSAEGPNPRTSDPGGTAPVPRRAEPVRATSGLARLKDAAREATVGEAGAGVVGGAVTALACHAIGHLVLVVGRAS